MAALFLVALHVTQRQLQQLPAVATRLHSLLQVVLRQIGHRHRQHHLAGCALRLLVQRRYHRGQYLLVALVELFLYLVTDAVDDGAVLHAHEVDVCITLVAYDTYHVHILHVGVHHSAASLILLQQVYLALYAFRLLEAQLGGEGVHLPLEFIKNVAKVAFQYAAYVLYRSVVFLAALLADARGSAETYLVLHARTVAHDVACTIGEELAYDVLQLAQYAPVGVGAVVLPLDVVAPCVEQAWVIFVGDAQIRVALVVLEHRVVARLVALDETVLQQQRVNLGGHHRDPDVVDRPHQHLNLGALVVIVREVAAHPALQVAGLAHIDDLAVGVEVLVDSRCFRYCLKPQRYALYVGVYGVVNHRLLQVFVVYLGVLYGEPQAAYALKVILARGLADLDAVVTFGVEAEERAYA